MMLELFQNEGILSVEAVTSNDGFYSSILDYRYINKKELSAHVEQFDRVIVMADGEALREISIEAVGFCRPDCFGSVGSRGRSPCQPPTAN